MGSLSVIAAAFIWGTVGITVRYLDLPIVFMVFWRVFIAAVAISGALALTGQAGQLKVGKSAWPLIILGLLLTFHWYAFFSSIRLTNLATASLITYLAPVLVAIFAPIAIKEPFERDTFFAIVIAIVGGAAILFQTGEAPGARDLAGTAWGLLAAVSYAALTLSAKYVLGRFSIGTILFYEEVVAALALTPFVFGVSAPGIGVVSIGLLVVLGAVQTAGAAGLYLYGLKRIPAARVGALSYIDPLTAALLAAVVYGEPFTPLTALGAALIITAGYIVLRRSA